VSLLRPPVTESSAPGAELIDKLEWKQVRILRTHAGPCLNYMRFISSETVIIYCTHLAIHDEHNAPDCFCTLLHLLHVAVQLVEALRYNPEGRGFDSQWSHWNFSLTKFYRPHYGPGFDSAYNRNEYQGYFLGVTAAGAWG